MEAAMTADETGEAEIEEEVLPKSDEDAPQLSLFPGGPEPTKSVLKLKSGKKEISNELERGQEIALLVHARVEEVHFAAETRTHVLGILDIFEHDTGDQSVAQAMMSDTEDAYPPEAEEEDEAIAEAEQDLDAPGAETPQDLDAGGDIKWE
jgi:hypothetical protein